MSGKQLPEELRRRPPKLTSSSQTSIRRWATDVRRAWDEHWRDQSDHRYGRDFAAFLGERFLTDLDLREVERGIIPPPAQDEEADETPRWLKVEPQGGGTMSRRRKSQDREAQHSDCPFCDYAGPSPVLWERSGVIIFEPLSPVTPGHLLVVPRLHATDFADSVGVARAVMEAAAIYVRERGLDDCNLITSRGPAATQTVGHFHLHIVPRRENDELALPWSEAQHSEVVVRPEFTVEEAERIDAVIGVGLDEDTVETPAPFALKSARAKLRAALAGEKQ